MKRFFFTILLFAVCLAWGHSDEETYNYVESLMEIAAASPEHADCIEDVNSTNEIEILFPSMNSLFEYEMPPDSCGFGWTTLEKQLAFDNFLMVLSTTNHTVISQKCKVAYDLALPLCIIKGYTNSIPALKNIIKMPDSELKGIAIRGLLSLLHPSIEMNSIVMSVATNKTQLTSYERCISVSQYIESLARTNDVNHVIVTNAANCFFANRYEIEHHIAVDRLMLFADEKYAGSSNRLEYAKGVMSIPDVPQCELAYFSSITNAVLSVK